MKQRTEWHSLYCGRLWDVKYFVSAMSRIFLNGDETSTSDKNAGAYFAVIDAKGRIVANITVRGDRQCRRLTLRGDESRERIAIESIRFPGISIPWTARVSNYLHRYNYAICADGVGVIEAALETAIGTDFEFY
jgi:hypothetical protein